MSIKNHEQNLGNAKNCQFKLSTALLICNFFSALAKY